MAECLPSQLHKTADKNSNFMELRIKEWKEGNLNSQCFLSQRSAQVNTKSSRFHYTD